MGRDSRFNLNSYEMPILSGDNTSEIYSNNSILHSRPTSITSNLSRSSPLINSCGSGLQRGLKRTSADMCYDPNMSNRSNLLSSDCGSDIMEETYSPTHQKNSPLSNGKKTKGRVKIKMEYIDNKLRRYTTFSKRKTGIMKKAYELSTLTGTQVMLLVASETGHVYTFATRKLQPMITSEAGKALIQTCLNSPDPCPSGSGDQRMSATGFEETELSYNIGDDDKVEAASLCSPYRSDSTDSSDVESVSGSPSSSPPPLISLQDFHSSSSAVAAAAASAVTRPESRLRCVPINALVQGVQKGSSSSTNTVCERKDRANGSSNNNSNSSKGNGKGFIDSNSSNADGVNSSLKNCSSNDAISDANVLTDGTNSSGASCTSSANLIIQADPLLKNGGTANGLIFTLEQLQREFGIHLSADASGSAIGSSIAGSARISGGDCISQYITIPMLSGLSNANTNPPAAHQTPADLSNRSRK